MAKQNKDSLNFSNYVAAFIDILGQQERLAQFSILPDTNDPDQYQRFVSVLKETIGVVHDLHDSFTRFFEAYRKQAVSREIPEDKKQDYGDLRKTNIKFAGWPTACCGISREGNVTSIQYQLSDTK